VVKTPKLGAIDRETLMQWGVARPYVKAGLIYCNRKRDVVEELQPGLELICMYLNPSRDLAAPFCREQPFLEFGCLISGSVRGRVEQTGGGYQHFSEAMGNAWYAYCQKARGIMEYVAGQPTCVVMFYVTGGLLDTFQPLFGPLSGLRRAARNDGGHCSRFCAYTGDVSRTIHQILLKTNERSDAMRLYFVAKAYELLYYLVSQGSAHRQPMRAPANQSALHRARNMLLEDIRTQPRLEDIAKRSGVCLTNLNAGFKREFGTTVFGLLRRERLSRAKHLIEYESMTAAEAAWEVGYSSLSSFHKAFSARYGFPPGHFGRQRKRGAVR
jgi:AraC-like DNA-binding protein